MNRHLKNNMLQTVENQLKMGEPKCTRETFERLLASGIDRTHAKEMIAGVLLEEMYYVLKNSEPFNEERFAEKLNVLESELLEETEMNYKDLTISEIFQSFEYNNGDFPDAALQEIIRRKEESVPFLLDFLKKVLENPQEYSEKYDYWGHIFAVYLLAQFRETEAYPVFIDILKLPEGLPDKLFGDVLTEAGGRILASICGGDINPIKDLIINKEVNEIVRAIGVMSLSILALQGTLSREEVIEYYRTLLTGGLPDQNSYVLGEVVSSSNNLYPEELIEEIRTAYQNELVDEMLIDLEFVEETLMTPKEQVLKEYRERIHYRYIHDAVEELRGCICIKEDFFPDEDDIIDIRDEYTPQSTIIKGVKTGRNDPCPCGSGKKYKKCCGQ